jgi:uncharacterized membrane protein YkvA (DUF1232 family)
VALLVYLALPLDIIPDFLPVIGQLDDLLIAGVAVASACSSRSRCCSC